MAVEQPFEQPYSPDQPPITPSTSSPEADRMYAPINVEETADELRQSLSDRGMPFRQDQVESTVRRISESARIKGYTRTLAENALVKERLGLRRTIDMLFSQPTIIPD